MSEIAEDYARAHLLDLLERVEAGERFLITRSGRAVAGLVPAGSVASMTARDAVEALRRFGDGRVLGPDLSVRDLIGGGRRG
ncbi:MAG: type II toxin-antitoxin system prevent-host-death family antitoxin [Longimicrobiales bacterium]